MCTSPQLVFLLIDKVVRKREGRGWERVALSAVIQTRRAVARAGCPWQQPYLDNLSILIMPFNGYSSIDVGDWRPK